MKLRDEAYNVIEFSDNLVAFPNILSYFGSAFWALCLGRYTSNFTYNDWVDVGQITHLYHLRYDSLFKSAKFPAPITAPCNGILVSPSVVSCSEKDVFFDGEPLTTSCLKMWLPKHEPLPKNANGMYDQFCSVVRENMELIFFKSKEVKSNGYTCTPEGIEQQLERQRLAPVKVYSLKNDDPKVYQQYSNNPPVIKRKYV